MLDPPTPRLPASARSAKWDGLVPPWETVEILEWAVLLCHLSEAVAAPLSLPRRSEAKAGRGDSPRHGDRAPWLQRDPVFQQSPRRARTGYAVASDHEQEFMERSHLATRQTVPSG